MQGAGERSHGDNKVKRKNQSVFSPQTERERGGKKIYIYTSVRLPATKSTFFFFFSIFSGFFFFTLLYNFFTRFYSYLSLPFDFFLLLLFSISPKSHYSSIYFILFSVFFHTFYSHLRLPFLFLLLTILQTFQYRPIQKQVSAQSGANKYLGQERITYK